ncbi:MAG: hypothetical protein J6C06_11065 [Lachnospiraceae bacterium]|nr:hypothetical protein [Lachnospiraceae bacterium]
MNNSKTKSKGYVLNLVEGKIIITKSFLNKSSEYGSDEYNILVGLRKDFPDFKIEEKKIKTKENKKSYKGLSIEEMRRFVNTRGKKEVEKFEKVCNIAETQKSKYAIIKKWFLDNYKDIYVSEIETIKVDLEYKENSINVVETEKKSA